MANTNDNDVALTWSSSATVTLNNNTNRVDSDAVAIDPNAVSGAISVYADNASTPSSGDVLDIWIAFSVDGTDFDTPEHGMTLGRLDTYGANDPGEDPVRKSFPLDVSGFQAFKLRVRGPQSASRNLTVSAVYNEHRMS